ncbi:MAG TPA: hypothetical protein VMG10_10290 [Gemmataceae bacterium]|nr:hypothetical protein [Gemmataceae bacterium]
MAGLTRRLLPLVLAIPALLLLNSPSGACPFCNGQGPTLTGEVAQAKLVLYGQLTNAARNQNEETTDLLVETVIKNELAGKKDDPLAGKNKTVRLDRSLQGTVELEKYRYLVYCDVFRGKIDPYRIVPVIKDGVMSKYLLGALKYKDEAIGKRLRFFFDYLDNADLEISNDAYKEFSNADYKDYKDMAKDLPAERVAKWLKDEKTPAFRYGLYASMLGHCGKAKDAKLLHDMLEDPAKRLGSGVDGMLAGYVMLKPKEGWAYTRAILKDGKKEFMIRYAALRSVRFLWDSRPDLVGHKQMKEGLGELLSQSDIADLAIDDLRKRQCWDMADEVLGLRSTKSYEIPIVRRAILRFALGCQDSKAKGSAAAKSYVAEQRQRDPQMVADAEELLKLEQMPPTISTPAK